MVSFAQLWEIIDKEKAHGSPLMTSGEDQRQFNVVRTGKDMHKEGETPFWDEFISLCADADGLSQLLGISREKITSWPARIQETLEKLEKENAVDSSQKEKQEMTPTGDNGAFTTNTDPSISNIGDII